MKGFYKAKKCLILWLAILFQSLSFPSFASPVIEKTEAEYPFATNLFQLRNTVTREQGRECTFDLHAIVLAADSDSGIVYLQDDTSEEAVQMDLQSLTLEPGQKIKLQGTNYVSLTDYGLSLGKRLVVDNGGVHTVAERSGAIYLKAGRHPIRVCWFNLLPPALLEVSYQGPGIPRQTIPDSILFRPTGQSERDGLKFANGLGFLCFEGAWTPGFAGMRLVKTGAASNFNIDVETRPEDVGLEFSGYLDIATEGLYTFFLSSDDGSLLYLDDPPARLTTIGVAPVPIPRQIVPGQTLPGRDFHWSEVEGNVTFLTRLQDGIELELGPDVIHIRVNISNPSEGLPLYLLHARVRVRGLCRNAYNDEQIEARSMQVPNWRSVEVLTVDLDLWTSFDRMTVDQLLMTNRSKSDSIVHVSGNLAPSKTEGMAVLSSQTGSVAVELLDTLTLKPGTEAECLGIWSEAGTNAMLRKAVVRELSQSPAKNILPLLTTAVQVQQLSRTEAQRKYPVKLKGVVTWVGHDFANLVIQDSTRAVFVELNSAWGSYLPSAGEYLEIEGESDPADYSPIVYLHKATRLGAGQMPLPLHPSLDQLNSGSMDAQYVEIRGLVTAVRTDIVSFLTSEGMFDLEVKLNSPEPLESYLNALVRVRGCLFQTWDSKTHEVSFEHPVRLENSIVNVDAPPPSDPFKTERISVSEMMQFDVRAGPFRRVKIPAQILDCRDGTYYAMDDGIGLRIKPARFEELNPGDTVEAVGFVQLGGASPILREAVVRKTGRAAPPPPHKLDLDQLGEHDDSTPVTVEGLLLDIKDKGAEKLLDVQVGLKIITARLRRHGVENNRWQVGSRLKLAGVFDEQNPARPGEHGVNTFELLVNSAKDIQVIARPPWWNLDRLLAAVAFLAAGLVLTFLWITLLRRQVERRTIDLRREMGERERAEKGRAVEQERARIARDLHDDLGSNLTEISMMAMTATEVKMNSSQNSEFMQQIADKSCSMVTALDALVWAVNPKNDTMASLVEYLASFGDEFFSRTQIAFQMDIPATCPPRIIAAETRHHVLLAVKEVLNNALRHAHPTEVSMRVTLFEDRCEIAIRDNGCGFDLERYPKGNGLTNLQARMHELKGQCRIQSAPGEGTSIILELPF